MAIRITKISLREDKATGISSSFNGANLDCMGFNLSYIVRANPKLAEKIMELYEIARGLESEDKQ